MSYILGEYDAERKYGTNTQKGWTAFSPTIGTGGGNDWGQGTSYSGNGTRIIYCSTSGRTGAAGTQADPFSSPGEASLSIRANSADWLLFRDGDVWTIDISVAGAWICDTVGNQPGFFQRLGASASNPILFGRYSDTGWNLTTVPQGTVIGAPPKFKLWNGSGSVISILADTSVFPCGNLFICGLTFHAFKQDPLDPGYDPTATKIGGINLFGSGVSNNTFYYEDVLTRACELNGNPDAGGTEYFRRTKVSHVRPGIGTGAFSGQAFVLFSEAMWYHCGDWTDETTRGPNAGFNHDVYGSYTDGGVAEYWLYEGCIAGYGSETGMRQRQGVLVNDSLFIGNLTGLNFGQSAGSPSLNVTVPRKISNCVSGSQPDGNSVSFSIVMNTPQATFSAISVTGCLALAPLGTTTTNEAYQVEPNSNCTIDATNMALGYSGSSALFGATAGDPHTGNTLGAVQTTSSGPNPNANMTSYATYLGLADETALWNAIESNRRYNWDYRLSAPAINDWFRSQVGMPLVGPGSAKVHPGLALRARMHA